MANRIRRRIVAAAILATATAALPVSSVFAQTAPAHKSKDLNVPFVGTDNRKGAQKVGDYLAKKLKSGDEVGIIEGVSTTTNAQQRTAGFKDAMQTVGAKVVSVQSGEWEIDKGNAVASAMLNEYPNL